MVWVRFDRVTHVIGLVRVRFQSGGGRVKVWVKVRRAIVRSYVQGDLIQMIVQHAYQYKWLRVHMGCG